MSLSSGHPLGHRAQRVRLAALAATGRLPSTILLAGPVAVGKYLVAHEIANSLLCSARTPSGEACGTCSACALTAAGNHPDLHVIEFSESAATDIDATREELTRLSLRSFLGGARVCILRDVEGMSLQIANLLLKTLEEPRPDTYFILTSASPSRLPQTVRSRTQVWFFDRLRDDDLVAIIERLGMSDAQKALPLEILEGTLEHLDLLASDDSSEHVQLWGDVREALDRTAAGDAGAGLTFLGELGKDKERILTIIDLMRLHCRHRMRALAASTAAGADLMELRRWALALGELVYARSLVSDRNLSAQSVLRYWIMLLSPEASPNSFTAREHSGSLLTDSIF